MCDPSAITNDWVVKGMHIHLCSVELRIVPDHLGGVKFRAVFSGTNKGQVEAAVANAKRCLADPDVRAKWLKRLESARVLMLGVDGKLAKIANGRMFEFKLLSLAFRRAGVALE